jgi:hypothetical protein
VRRGAARRTVLLIRSLFHAPRGELVRAAAPLLERGRDSTLGTGLGRPPDDFAFDYRPLAFAPGAGALRLSKSISLLPNGEGDSWLESP